MRPLLKPISDLIHHNIHNLTAVKYERNVSTLHDVIAARARVHYEGSVAGLSSVQIHRFVGR